MVRALLSLYGPNYANVLVYMLQTRDYQVGPYLACYWQTQNFGNVAHGQVLVRTKAARRLTLVLRLGMFSQMVVGFTLLSLWYWHSLPGGWEFGLALVLSYPIVWAHLAGLLVWFGWLLRPKKLGRIVICYLLERQVRRLRQQHKFTVVAVIGSIGKTSTKAAIANTLANSRRVLWQQGNYNDRVTVPLIFFNQSEPSLTNVFAWCKVLLQNAWQIWHIYPYDIVVVELGPDGPGQLRYFEYVQPDLLVLTAIAPEHMEFFGTLDAVAAEELVPFGFSKKILVNTDDVPAKYLVDKHFTSYGLEDEATYRATNRSQRDLHGQRLKLHLGKKHELALTVSLLGAQGAKIAMAAAAVADLLGLTDAEVEAGLQVITHFPGRMQILPGLQNTTLIDDTYNASPLAVNAALDVLYKAKASQRIAMLGSMNELGDYSPEAHREVGEYCDPKKLDVLVTIGKDAAAYLAPAARGRGCKVETFDSPLDAGKFVRRKLQTGAVVLAKGSQNHVFAEEAIKFLLADPADATKLVRQSSYWLEVKRRQFGKLG